MPDEPDIFITFPEPTVVSVPSGASVTFPGIPGSPPLDMSQGVGLSVPAGGEISFPATGLVVVTPSASQPPFQLDPVGGTISIPNSSRPPVPIGDLFDLGLGISFPAGTTASFPGQQVPMIAFPANIIVRVRRRVPLPPDGPRPDL